MSNWDNNTVQFARLLCELVAAGVPNEQTMQELQESMDLSAEDIDELFERANSEWEAAKARSVPEYMTIDDLIEELQQLRDRSYLEGEAVVHLCVEGREYIPVSRVSLDQTDDQDDGSVVLVHVPEGSVR